MKTRIQITAFAVLLLLAACGGVMNPGPKQLTVVNHWGGNTGGKGHFGDDYGDAISNFVVDIAVLNKDQPGLPFADQAPLVVTKSYWDETGWADGVYAGGKRITKGEFLFKPHDDTHWPGITFDTTSYNGITATIAHPHVLDVNHDPSDPNLTSKQRKDMRQQNAEDQGTPLTAYQDNLPYVALSDGRTIKSIAFPTSMAFDRSGRLWIADNGPDQNFKIFNVPTSGVPTLLRSFGVPGGVYAGPTRGLTGEKRFWGPRGVGFGDNGEIFVGTSGIPGQTLGGTDVRAFDSAEEFLWDVKGIFMHSPGIDPTSNGTQIYTAGQRYEMDFSKVPGKSWRQAAITIDPYRYPADPRLINAYDIAFIRVINGKKFLFASDMSEFDLAVFRFEENSEIAIPTAFIGIGGSQQGAEWTQGKAPVWDAGLDENKNRRLMWRDANGNGAVDTGEFSDIQLPTPYTRALDVDDNGNVWVAGHFNAHDYEHRFGGNLIIPFGNVDSKGVPFSGSVPRFVDVPSALVSPEDRGITSGRMRYLAASDTLLMATGTGEDYYTTQVYVIDGHLNSSKTPKLRFKLNLGYDDLGSPYTDILDPRLDPAIRDAMVLPTVFAADADYLYVGYMQNGLDAKVRGEITVYSMVDGHKVGWIVPGPETNHFAGNFDMRHGIQVSRQSDGTRIIVAEEGGAGKFMVYRWKPGS